jgi:TonB-linked SusC/RagA family outer membrane protein
MIHRYITALVPVLFLVYLPPHVSAQVYASGAHQQLKNDLPQREAVSILLQDVLHAMEKEFNVNFSYENSIVKDKVITVHVDPSEPMEIRLEKILSPLGLYYEKNKDYYFILKVQESQLPTAAPKAIEREAAHEPVPILAGETSAVGKPSSAFELTITGTVTEAGVGPLPGVNVLLKGTNTGTVTDANGRYALSIPSADGVLIFSYIGYLTQEVSVGAGTVVDMALIPDIKTLGEIVVVGYGTQKKATLTGAVSAVSAADFESRPITSMSSGLQGLLPGVVIRNFTGMPGQNGSTIRIRGIGTLGDSNPLIVIDGMPGGSMDILNLDDIENISVLKDAASSSIYGVRGANGVILITTKKGKANAKPTISYSNYFGLQTPTALPEFLGSVDYMTLLNESQRNVGRPETYTDSMVTIARTGADLNYYANTNWLKEIYKERAAQQSHNISITGGSTNLSYYLSYGYLNQDGLVTGDQFGAKRNNIRLRLNTKLIDRLELDANLGYIDRTFSQSSEDVGEATGPIYAAHQISPLVPVRFTTGGWGYLGGSRNPVAVATDGGYHDFSSYEFTGNLRATLAVFKGFKLMAQYGLINATSQREIFSNTIDYFSPVTGDRIYQTNFPNKIDKRDYVNTYQTVIGMAEYENSFGSSDLKTLVGVSQETNIQGGFTASRTGVISPTVPNINVATSNLLNSASADQTALQSLFGRVNYAFANKYLAEINFRYDGSSRFAKEVRWNLFPSASVGWRIGEEKFFNSLTKIFQEVKVRASYGELGNDKVGSNYAYLATLGPVGGVPPIGNVLTYGYAQTTIPNPLLTWETVSKQNIGLDVQLLRNRLGITADYFTNNTSNILLRVNLPDVLGATEPAQNAGKVENKGWELQLSWKDKTNQLSYGANANISDVTNSVTSLGGVPPTVGDQVRFLGEPIDAFYGLVAERISQISDYDYNATTNIYKPKFPTITGDKVGPGDIMYEDISGDGEITLVDDRKIIGNPFPRYTYGFRLDLGWKGFDFTIFIQGVGKANGYIKGAARHAYINESANPQKIHLDRWTPENTEASYPRLTYQQTHNQRFSTFWLEDASYMRLKNIQLGYTLPLRWVEKYWISRLRIFASAENLFTLTNFFSAYDPETPVSTGGYYPQVKTFIIGVNLNLK